MKLRGEPEDFGTEIESARRRAKIVQRLEIVQDENGKINRVRDLDKGNILAWATQDEMARMSARTARALAVFYSVDPASGAVSFYPNPDELTYTYLPDGTEVTLSGRRNAALSSVWLNTVGRPTAGEKGTVECYDRLSQPIAALSGRWDEKRERIIEAQRGVKVQFMVTMPGEGGWIERPQEDIEFGRFGAESAAAISGGPEVKNAAFQLPADLVIPKWDDMMDALAWASQNAGYGLKGPTGITGKIGTTWQSYTGYVEPIYNMGYTGYVQRPDGMVRTAEGPSQLTEIERLKRELEYYKAIAGERIVRDIKHVDTQTAGLRSFRTVKVSGS